LPQRFEIGLYVVRSGRCGLSRLAGGILGGISLVFDMVDMTRSALPAQPRRSNLALGNQAIWGMWAKYLRMPAVLAMIALVLLALPSGADEQRVRIPDACRELADRAGLPLTLTRAEATRAIGYLRVIKSQDPAVLRCRLAILSAGSD